ncbi:MAG: hypothetical protein ACQSGP_13270 [Frankia sp.]
MRGGVGWARTARAAVFAVAAVTLAATAHAAGDGMAPAPRACALAVALVFVGALLAAERERSFVGIAGGMVAVQAALHAAFMLATPISGGESPAAAALSRAMSRPESSPAYAPTGHAASSMAGMAGMAGMPGMGSAGTSASPWSSLFGGPDAIGMLTAHLIAALLLAWCLRRGEAAWWALVRATSAVGRHLGLVFRIILVTPAGPARVRVWARGSDAIRRPRFRLLRHALVLRGPPTALITF